MQIINYALLMTQITILLVEMYTPIELIDFSVVKLCI